jgi:tRNA G10  N-methylase Trm11
MDPFCGYGSIPEQRTKRFPFQKCYAFDTDADSLDYARKKLSGASSARCQFEKIALASVLALKPELAGTIDAIITDPPWGLYQKADSASIEGLKASAFEPSPSSSRKRREAPDLIEQFYEEMMGVFARLLKPDGAALILAANHDALARAVQKAGCFETKRIIPILLSGKKAIVFALKRV